MAIFDLFRTKKPDTLSHWYTPVSNFNISTQDFYAAVEKELATQKVPDLDISRVEFSEGGILSGKRQYLRMTRERLVFDICAAPFGVNYFFSCRFAELPAKISLMALAIVFVSILAILGISLHYFGFVLTCFLGIAGLGFGVYALRNTGSLGLNGLDAWLLQNSFFGPIYERFFRKETYYRQDTRMMYLTVVEGVVKKLVEQETSAKGIKLLAQYEYAPILGELYKYQEKQIGKKSDTTV